MHFLGIGLLLFVLYGIVSDDEQATDSRRIELTVDDVARLEELWAKQWRRPPTDFELRRLIDEQIREEVLYREAIAMGLDQDDTIIRRRLAQKMEFITEDLANQIEPSDEQLLEFYRENSEMLSEPARITFTHAYFSTDQRGTDAATDAELELLALQGSNVERAAERGDRFMLEYDYKLLTERQLGGLFGLDFAQQLFELPVNEWVGPVRSGYGVHVVRIIDKEDQYLPAFESIRGRVQDLYMSEQRRNVNEQVFEKLKSRYEIVVPEMLEAESLSAVSESRSP